MTFAFLAASAIAWVGHAAILTAALNYLYGCPIPKWFLRHYRTATGLAIVGFPLLVWSMRLEVNSSNEVVASNWWSTFAALYLVFCLLFGGVVFPAVTIYRLLRRTPAAVLAERTEAVDFGKLLGPAAVGDGKWAWAARLPLNDCFTVDFTELTLAVRGLPPGWDGLTIQLLSDLHFYGSPGRAFFEAVLDRVAALPRPDLVVLAGDYLDTDRRHEWIVPLLGRLAAGQGKFAILGNHDQHHHPDRVRSELIAAGYTVLDNTWKEVTVRGERAIVVGHEGPWFRPPPDLTNAPEGPFRLCVSHTPDNFYWGQRHGVGLMLCGHVHGGQIRVPVVGSIFVPSVYGRRFDMGVFDSPRTLMVVNRGLSGKEPLRFRCHAQVMRLTLKPR